MPSDIEIPQMKNVVFLFTRNAGLIQFHTYSTSEELKELLLKDRTTMAFLHGSDEGGAGKVDQWFETVNDGKWEIIAMAVKLNVGGRIAAPGQGSAVVSH